MNRRKSNFWATLQKKPLHEKWCSYSIEPIRSLFQNYLAGECWRRLWRTAILLGIDGGWTFPKAWCSTWKLVELAFWNYILAPTNYFSLFWKLQHYKMCKDSQSLSGKCTINYGFWFYFLDKHFKSSLMPEKSGWMCGKVIL